MKYLLMLLISITYSCSVHIKGPNYNQGRDHNKVRENRIFIVNKEDKRMKLVVQKQMNSYKRRNRIRIIKSKRKYIY